MFSPSADYQLFLQRCLYLADSFEKADKMAEALAMCVSLTSLLVWSPVPRYSHMQLLLRNCADLIMPWKCHRRRTSKPKLNSSTSRYTGLYSTSEKRCSSNLCLDEFTPAHSIAAIRTWKPKSTSRGVATPRKWSSAKLGCSKPRRHRRRVNCLW